MEPAYRNKKLKFTYKENQPIKIPSDSSTNYTSGIGNPFWQRFLLVQGIGWIGGLGIVGGNLAWALSSTGSDGILLAQIPQTMPKAVPQDTAPEASSSAAPIFTTRERSQINQRSRLRRQNQKSRSVAGNYSNSHIDPTDYNLGATSRRSSSSGYQAPSSIVLTERRTGCQRVYQGRGLAGGSCGGGVASARTRVRRNAIASENNSTVRRRVSPQIARSNQTSRVARSNQTQLQTASAYQLSRQSRRPSGQTRSYQASQPLATPIGNDLAPSSYRSSRVARSYQSRRSSVVSNQVAAAPVRNHNQFVSRRNYRQPSRRSVSVAAVGQVNIGPVTINSRGIGIRKHTSYKRNISNGYVVNTADRGVTSNQALPHPALNYYYNQANPSDAPPGHSELPIIFPLAIPAQITSVFGWRVHPITGNMRFHSGTDIGAPMGTPVLAAYAGKVTIADFLGGYGLSVILRHNNDNHETRYAHLSEIFVKPGEWVEQGTVIGKVGSTGNSTGPHLHFEVREQTPQGWVALDPGAQLEYGLAQLVGAFKTARVPESAKTEETKDENPDVAKPDLKLPIIEIPKTLPAQDSLPKADTTDPQVTKTVSSDEVLPPAQSVNSPIPEVPIPNTQSSHPETEPKG